MLTVIISSFNLTHILVLLFFPLFAIGTYFFFKNKSEKTKIIFFYVVMAIAFLSTWLTFASDMITDRDNCHLNFWSRLPLHMCSINVILYPLFFFLRNKVKPLFRTTLFSYMFFVGSAGALLAMLVTSPGDCLGPTINFFTYNVFTYWLKHGLIFIIPILLVSLGFYRPQFKDTIKATIFLIIALVIMELVNLLFSYFGKLNGSTVISNFFYTRDGRGTAVLETFYNFIPVELLYMFPIAIIALPIFMIYYSPFFVGRLIMKKKNKAKE